MQWPRAFIRDNAVYEIFNVHLVGSMWLVLLHLPVDSCYCSIYFNLKRALDEYIVCSVVNWQTWSNPIWFVLFCFISSLTWVTHSVINTSKSLFFHEAQGWWWWWWWWQRWHRNNLTNLITHIIKRTLKSLRWRI